MKILSIVDGGNCTTITYQKEGIIYTVPVIGIIKNEEQALRVLNTKYKYSN